MAFTPKVIEGGGQPQPDERLKELWEQTKADVDRLIADGRLEWLWLHFAEADSADVRYYGDPARIAWAVRRAAEDALDAEAGLLG